MSLKSLYAIGCLLALISSSALAERSADDLERDVRDRPETILAFAGITPGMTVLDLFAAGGYYSEWLAKTVGEGGHVLMYDNPAYAAYGKKALTRRFADGKPAQLESRVAEVSDMGLGERRFDRAIMVMSLHDVYWVNEKEGWPAIDRDRFLAQVVAALKPGGALLVVDHAAADDFEIAQVDALHRINERFVQSELERHGLKLEAQSDLIRQQNDDHRLNVFDPAIRGKTDRFVQLYRKPAAD